MPTNPLARERGGEQRVAVPHDRWHTPDDDDHIPGAGAVGVWTKADSVTRFDDFRWGR